jgi:predicted signal transduction protein with EAL and GGDEF domain
MLTGRTDANQTEWVGLRILSILRAPFQQGNYALVVTPCIGVAMYPEHGSDAQSLLKNADGAMYDATLLLFGQCKDIVAARAVPRDTAVVRTANHPKDIIELARSVDIEPANDAEKACHVSFGFARLRVLRVQSVPMDFVGAVPRPTLG